MSDARVTPRKVFAGRDPARLRFTLSAARARVTVEIVAGRGDRIARRIVLRDVPAGVAQRVVWNGVTGRGRAAPDGRYRVRLIVPGAGVRRLLGQFVLRGHMYPIRGPHRDRGGIGFFGAPRNGGRTHEGFDVNAACGTRLAAARAGRVTRSRYDPVLYGNEVIVRGWLDGRAYRYAHLRDTPLVGRGDWVRTGQRIGYVGDTGNARTVGCHLHFELRSRTGGLLDPEPFLHAWDRFG
ncbi:MAG TPA: peptidoglycan DD-metalloendopeptidase family protein [Casimicrobiaceae bacterium]